MSESNLPVGHPWQDLATCPNCGATMNVGESCPECEHVDDYDCQCDACAEEATWQTAEGDEGNR